MATSDEAFDLNAAGTALLGHPRLDEALRHSARGALALARDGGRLGRLYQDHGSQMIMTMALTQSFTDEGLTVERFKALCLDAGLASPGRARRLMDQLIDRGALIEADAGGDRRRRRLAPTPELLVFIDDRARVDLEAAAMVSPATAALLPRFDEPGFRPWFNRAMAETMAGMGPDVGGLKPELALFGYRNGGLFLLIDILDQSLSPAAAVKVSVAGWAARLGVSRAHVLKLLRDADAAGLIAWTPERREVVASPGLIEAVRGFFAFMYAALGQVLAVAARSRDAAEGRYRP